MTYAHRTRRSIAGACLALAALLSASISSAQTATLLNGYGGPAGFGVDAVPRGDDLSSPEIPLTTTFPGGITLNGQNFTSVYVNINGNLSFGNLLSAYTPTAFPGATVPIVAAWWADVDTRLIDAGAETDGIYWHLESGLMVATWYNVGYFDQHRDRLNSFQIILRTATGTGSGRGDVDIEFRYNRCEWTTGDASGGDGGLGGTIAGGGYDFTAVLGGSPTAFSVLPGSLTSAVVNLCTDSNIGSPGVWSLRIRSGVVTYCGNGTVDPGEACDPTAGPVPECTPDCRLCTPVTCPDAGMPDVFVPDVVEPDASDVPEPEVSLPDAGAPDVEVDAALPDVAMDAGNPDVTLRDVAVDAALDGPDAVVADASIDAGADAGLDAGLQDAAPDGSMDARIDSSAHTINRYAGGGLFACGVATRTPGRAPYALFGVVAALVVARRRRGRGQRVRE